MKRFKPMKETALAILLSMVMVMLVSPSFAAVDEAAIKTQIEVAITAAQEGGQEVDAALIEEISTDILTQNLGEGNDPISQAEAVASVIVKTMVALNVEMNLNLNESDVVLGAGRGAVQGVNDMVASGAIEGTMSSAMQAAVNDGATEGAQQAGVSMDTILLIGSDPPAGADEQLADENVGDTPEPVVAEAFEPADPVTNNLTPPPAVIGPSVQDLAASSPM